MITARYFFNEFLDRIERNQALFSPLPDGAGEYLFFISKERWS
jgi:hypothetical protein